MWAYLRAMSVWAMWTFASWQATQTPDVDRPGDDDQFARWLDDDKEGMTGGKA